MSRFLLPLCAACVIAPSLVSAYDETTDANNSLKNATREELLEKITSLELELAKLKSQQQKHRSTQQQALTNWLTYTAPVPGKVSPVPTPLPPGMFAWPSYPDPNADGSHYPSMPNTYMNSVSGMPKGTTPRRFKGMTIYLIPCNNGQSVLWSTIPTVPAPNVPNVAGPGTPRSALPPSQP